MLERMTVPDSGRNRGTASDFSVMDLVNPGETQLSQIFAELLKPNGTHAQGGTFLGLLLEELCSTPQSVSAKAAPFGCPPVPGCCVKTEQATGDIEIADGSTRSGRIDIVIEFEDGRCIAIENKPFAWEQPEQIKRYLRYLACRDGVLLYWIGWSGEESDPDLAGLSKSLKDRYVKMPYWKTAEHPSVEGWLSRCRNACEAPRVQLFLDDLIGYVVRRFPDVPSLLYDNEYLRGRAEMVGGGWLFRQSGWTGSWPGVWISRWNQHSLQFDIGASGWPAGDLGKLLREAGERSVGAQAAEIGAWTSHKFNRSPDDRHVSWTFDGDKAIRTDDRDDRERGVNAIIELAKVLMKAAAAG